jgi:glycosyltransferase involved in cell wall biosynthesis
MSSEKKIKVLVVPSDRSGVGYFRSVAPHIGLERFYPNEFHVDIEERPDLNNDEYLKQYDIIHYHRSLGQYEQMPMLLNKLKNLGITTIMDLDDYWAPGTHHPAYLIIKNSKMDEKIIGNLKIAENITTTTDIFAKEIAKHNKNVHVLPNAIDPTERQYMPNPEKSDRIRIGWLGGSSHLEDLKLLNGLVNKFKSDNLLDKVQFVLCGFDLRGNITMINPETGEQTQRPIKPMESVWYKYEQIFTDNYSTVSEGYKNHLLSFSKEEYEGIENEPYRRVWTKPVSTYASNYNLFDISLAPLADNIFNKVKSQLKVIESGFHKKALVAQDFGPYQIDLVNSRRKPTDKKDQNVFNEHGNAYLVNNDSKEWYQFLKRLVTNPEQIEILSNNLYNTVKDTYSIEAVSKQRRELYLSLLDEKRNNNVQRVSESDTVRI